ncbi:assembly of actin patch protein [Clarireedia jacksonii]
MSITPFKVKAVYEYTSPHDDDLHFPSGQIITVTEEEDADWYSGEYVDASGVKQEGIFPRNFVEKYEPTAPPRPTRVNRPKKDAESIPPATAPEPVRAPISQPEPETEPEAAPEAPVVQEQPHAPAPIPKVTKPANPASPPPAPAVAKLAPSQKPSSPPVSEKPSAGSFRDRIAAFNKAAPPPAPFKPAGFSSGGSNNFIKKPFVAPPPRKDAYIPPPREAPPTKIYRREEDPEIAAKETENQEQAERAGLAPTSPSNNDGEEEQPKPTSLKERIALLQKQQMEQAARHADAAMKKEKPKRPPKKRLESHDIQDGGDTAGLESKEPGEAAGKASMDSTREEETALPRRPKSSRDTAPISIEDGNEADMSNAAETTAEEMDEASTKDDSDDKPRARPPHPPVRAPAAPAVEPDVGEEEGAVEEPEAGGDAEEEEEEEEDDIDPEVRRKEELRARMAKMSGGMGMHGMFGGGMPMPAPLPPKKKKPSISGQKRPSTAESESVASPLANAPPVPMIPLPGLSRVRSSEETEKKAESEDQPPAVSTSRPADVVPDVEDVVPQKEEDSAPPPVPSHEASAPPPVPSGRPAPPPVPTDSRPVTAASSMPMSPSVGSESDDEMSARASTIPISTPSAGPPQAPPRPEGPSSPRSPPGRRPSYFSPEQLSSAQSPGTSGNRRASRVPPPIPLGVPPAPSQDRAPPPPPPGATLSRSSTGDKEVVPASNPPPPPVGDEEGTEYEGDYDTDIASAAPHKDALKSHTKEAGDDNSSIPKSPLASPTFSPPPLPPQAPPAPRAVPPPLPSQPPPRVSADIPSAAPPPPPSAKAPAPWEPEDNVYDPFNYSAKANAPSYGAPATPKIEQGAEEDLYSASPPRSAYASPTQVGRAPPQTPNNRPSLRQSLDVSRSGVTAGARRSTDLNRMAMDSGFIANDVDLAPGSQWWTVKGGIPPIFHDRKDILTESDDTSSISEANLPVVTRELYVLFIDYSQTIIAAQYNPKDPADCQLEQKHEPPPARLRQDQLEQAHEQFGRRIIEAVGVRQNTIVGDGTPQGLVMELLKPLPGVLMPVGSRGYGAIVYSNLGNASTQQFDEIRQGDIVTFRNTRFQGKHGSMHTKYTAEVGKPDHVGVVAEWDGTKKKLRAWEQGRESKKVKLESFKLDDLRSGEVKIWRVMPRSWVGWSPRQ